MGSSHAFSFVSESGQNCSEDGQLETEQEDSGVGLAEV